MHGQQLNGLFYSWSGQLECEDGGVNGPVIAGLTLGLLTGLLLLLFACIYWRKKPWVLSIFRRKEKKRLSVGPNFTGNKKDINKCINNRISINIIILSNNHTTVTPMLHRLMQVEMLLSYCFFDFISIANYCYCS